MKCFHFSGYFMDSMHKNPDKKLYKHQKILHDKTLRANSGVLCYNTIRSFCGQNQVKGMGVVMKVKIEHTALYVSDLEEMRRFYETHFEGVGGRRYHNPSTGLETYFLSFGDGARLELMTRPGLAGHHPSPQHVGYIHIAFSVRDREAVDLLTARLRAAGCKVLSGPRTTGDGYYESCVLDPEGNQVEIVAEH